MQSHAEKKKNAADGAEREPQSRAAAHRVVQRERMPATRPVAPNRTGLPDGLKAGLETLSGFAMDDVRVHYGSQQPAQLQAHAYAQGAHIHVAPGQERHLPHEAWHVVQQMQHRVPVTQRAGNGTPVNDDVHLEREADFMGAKAALNTAAGPGREPLRQAMPFGPAQLVRKKAKNKQVAKGDSDEEEEEDGDTAEDIQLLLTVKASEAGDGAAPQLTEEEEARVLRYLQNAPPALRDTRNIKASLRNFMLAEGGALSLLVSDGRPDAPPKKPRKPRRKAEDKQKAWQKQHLFDDDESELSDNDEIPLGYLRQNYGNTFKPATDHSRADKEEGEFLDASNTNLLLFWDGSLIPRTINGEPNTGATRKRKRSLSQKLQGEQDELRAKQESFYFGSHLPTDQEGELVTDDSIKRVKRETKKEDNPALHRLLSYTLPGFAQKGSHTHGEQSVLRSQVWDNLVQKLVDRLLGLVGAEGEEDEGPEVTTIALVLNRSSCIECARTMSVAVVLFWRQVAESAGLGTAQEAREALGEYVRFVARFPTIYEHDKERGRNFQNLDAILNGLLEAGWEIQPFAPAIEGGLDSHNDLVSRLSKAKGGKAEKEDYGDNAAIYTDSGEEFSESGSDDEEDDYRLLRANNCLLVAMNGGADLDEGQLAAIRGELFEEGHADYAAFVEANEATVGIIAGQLGITSTIVHVTHMEHEGEAIFVVDPDGAVTELENEDDKANIDTNAAYNAYGYILIDYAGNHFEKKR